MWQPALEDALAASCACAVLIGPSGIGSWQRQEVGGALAIHVTEGLVIPVLLPGASGPESLPLFLGLAQSIDLRRGLDDSEPFGRLLEALKSPSVDDRQQLEARYRRHLISWLEHLSLYRSLRAGDPRDVPPLEELFVMLRAVADLPRDADKFENEESSLLLELDNSDAETPDEITNRLDELRQKRWRRALPESRPILEFLNRPDEGAFVILGEPGSGKTMLARFLALTYARGPAWAADRLGIELSQADRLPIFAPLAAFEELRNQDEALSLETFLWRFFEVRRQLPGLGTLFSRALADGRALILLDGLDEVADPNRRNDVAEQLRSLIGRWASTGVRFVVTSRFAAYRSSPISPQVAILSLLEFGEREIKLFTERWHAALGPRRAEEPTTTGQEHPSIRRLAANPLMLTLLALSRDYGDAPTHRVELFERYVRMHLDRLVVGTALRRPWNRHHTVSVLAKLALWFQLEKPGGTASQVELLDKLAEIRAEEEGSRLGPLPPLEHQRLLQQAEGFLEAVRQMSGLLAERGYRVFGFLHLALQEYFVAQALVGMSADERWKTISRRIFDPRWQEPILLCAARLGMLENRRTEARELIEVTLRPRDDAEELHRSLQLALAIACEVPDSLTPELTTKLVSRTVECLPACLHIHALGTVLMSSLAQLIGDSAEKVREHFDRVWTHQDWQVVRNGFAALSRASGASGARAVLLEQLADPDWGIRSLATAALSRLVETDRVVRAETMHLLDDPAPEVRRTAVDSLAQTAWLDEVRITLRMRLDDPRARVRRAAIAALADHLDDVNLRLHICGMTQDPHREVRQYAIQAIAGYFKVDSRVRSSFLRAIRQGSDPEMKRSVLLACGPLVSTDSDLLETAQHMLDDDHWLPRKTAIDSLRDSIEQDRRLRTKFLRMLQTDWHQEVLEAAAKALGRLASGDDSVRSKLLDKLHDRSATFGIRWACLEALNRAPDGGSPTTSDHEPWSLLDSWQPSDPDGYTMQPWVLETQRRQVGRIATYLARIGDQTHKLAAGLRDPANRLKAGLILVEWPGGPPPDTALEILSSFEEQAGLESRRVRLTAASYLIKGAEAHRHAVDLCIEELRATPMGLALPPANQRLPVQAALALGRLHFPETEKCVWLALSETMREHPSGEVRDACHEALTRLANWRDHRALDRATRVDPIL